MSESSVSRRDLLRVTAASALAGEMTVEAAQHVHKAAETEKKQAGVYKPKCFNAHEYRTLSRLADLIIPADAHSGGAVAAGAPEFIDTLAGRNDELAAIYTGGLAWLDRETERRHGARFVDAKPEAQTAMLDLIAFRRDDAPELAAGNRFFEWARKMTVDAFYTSKIGMADLGFQGNTVVPKFVVPEDTVKSALKRSGLG